MVTHTFTLTRETDTLKLILDPRVYLAGERIIGRVDVDLAQVKEESVKNISIKLHGSISTRMAQRHYSYATHKQTSQTRTQHIDLVREERVLWDEQGSEPQPRPQYGFEFILPSGLPSSFDSDSHDPGGTISYVIEVVADRHGLHFDRKVAKILSVMPIAAPEQVQAAGQLHRGWQGPWTTVEHTESVKKHIWSDDSRMEIHLVWPYMASFPIGVPIPISLFITTFTKSMEKEDTPADAFELASESLFPAPPIDPANVKLKLKANTTIGVHGQSRSHISDMGTLGGLGDFDGDVTKQPHPLISKPEWIPEDEKKGRWKWEVKFDTTLLFACTPTIQTQALTCQYELDIDIRLPGLGNDFDCKIPIQLNSGAGPQPQAMSAGPIQFPMAENRMLPPSYFSGENHVWSDSVETSS